MPKGNPNAQTLATETYRKKNGIISKNFKLKRELCDAFAEACADKGESQTAVIARMMRNYINKK